MDERMRPIFEIFSPDMSRHYKIYANGQIEGFEPGMCIVNSIHPLYEDISAISSEKLAALIDAESDMGIPIS